ncbi:MAG: flagellar biosynthesis protein FlhA [Myxococcales bacterium]|nr:flagellar biosynthesis protein FlhA [Myxococcales bacterium]
MVSFSHFFRGEVIFVTSIISILFVLVVPIPGSGLDILLAINIIFASLVLFSVLVAKEVLSISSFPTLLLLTTLFRLSLNVSTTRMILSEGQGNAVVQAFGEFVGSGDLVTGLVIYLLITLIQLVVIGRGAERVAEVAARFTLDAMPGKQMSIDAALRAGAISDEEADNKRNELSRQAQFYGAMDGAMKFVKGDATLGLIITGLNLIAGLGIGTLRLSMPIAEALETFAILTIGDGLVSQIPALLLALASGLVTTRVAAKNNEESLSSMLHLELLANPQVLGFAAAFATILSLTPALPTIPFLFVATSLGLGVWYQSPFCPSWLRGRTDFNQSQKERLLQARAQRATNDELAPTVHPLSIDLSAQLSSSLGFGVGQDPQTELMSRWLPEMRDALYAQTGIRIPSVRVRAGVTALPPNAAVIKVNEVPVAVEHINTSKSLVLGHLEELNSLGIPVEPTNNPLGNGPAGWISIEDETLLTGAGIAAWNPSGALALYLLREVRSRVADFIGLQETAELVRRMEKISPDLVETVIPKLVSLSQLRDVLRRLADENVSIRDLRSILEALGELGDRATGPRSLVEHVRTKLAVQITFSLAGPDHRLPVATLHPKWEDVLSAAVVDDIQGSYIALAPPVRLQFLQAVQNTIQPISQAGLQPVLLTRGLLRYPVRTLLEPDTSITVLAFSELPKSLVVHPVGSVEWLEVEVSPSSKPQEVV